MIIVVLGGSEARRDLIIAQLMAAEKGMIKHLDITPLLKNNDKGFNRLRVEFSRSPLSHVITIVSGITTGKQLDFLRSKKAIICHCYGPLIMPLYEEIQIKTGDFHVSPVPLPRHVPKHIFIPAEIISECFFIG